MVIALVIVLIIFGPKRLPQLGRQLGTGMREFKDSITGKDKGDDVEVVEADEEPDESRTEASAALGRPSGDA